MMMFRKLVGFVILVHFATGGANEEAAGDTIDPSRSKIPTEREMLLLPDVPGIPSLIKPETDPQEIKDVPVISRQGTPPIQIPDTTAIPKPGLKNPTIPDPNRGGMNEIIQTPLLHDITKSNLPKLTAPEFQPFDINTLHDMPDISNTIYTTSPGTNIRHIPYISKQVMPPIEIKETSGIPKSQLPQIPDHTIPAIHNPNSQNINMATDKIFIPDITKINVPQIEYNLPTSNIKAFNDIAEIDIPNKSTPQMVIPPIRPIEFQSISNISKPEISPIDIPSLSFIPKPPVHQIPDPDPQHQHINIKGNNTFHSDIRQINESQITMPELPPLNINAFIDTGTIKKENIHGITTPQLVTPPLKPINIQSISNISKPEISPITIPSFTSIQKPPMYHIPEPQFPQIPHSNSQNINITVDNTFLSNITKINVPPVTKPEFPPLDTNVFEDTGTIHTENIRGISIPQLVTPPLKPINIQSISNISKPEISPITIPSLTLIQKPTMYHIPEPQFPQIPYSNSQNINITLDNTFLSNITKINVPPITKPEFQPLDTNLFKDTSTIHTENIRGINIPQLVTPPLKPINIQSISNISKPEISPITIPSLTSIQKPTMYHIPEPQFPQIPHSNSQNINITLDNTFLSDITKINVPPITKPEFPH
ncbi:periaxin-like [Macrobrachium nipponense]|uniref:periaxin-like n=1 Tax=Macrobrachium nipponense TaxID=159736 RepID=UPI0030C838E4